MTKCDCNERMGIKINSWIQFKRLKEFFEEQVKEGLFIEVPVERPYHIGYSANGKAMKWYADKWYKCLECDVLWEFVYPDFPAQGFVRKFSAGGYIEKGTVGMDNNKLITNPNLNNCARLVDI